MSEILPAPEPTPETELKITTTNLDLSLNKEDLVAVAVAKYRETVNAELAELKKEQKELQTTLEVVDKRINDLLLETMMDIYRPLIEAHNKFVGAEPTRIHLADANVRELHGRNMNPTFRAVSNVQLLLVYENEDKSQWTDFRVSINLGPAIPRDKVEALQTKVKAEQEACKEPSDRLKKVSRRIEMLHSVDYHEYRDNVQAKLAQSIMNRLTGEDAKHIRQALHLDEELALPASPPKG